MNLRTRLLGCFILACVQPALAAAPEPCGTWIGQWERDGSKLDVEVVFECTASGYAGAFSSSGLRVTGIPFKDIQYQPPQMSWALVGDETTMLFDGTLDNDLLAGRFREGDAIGTFRLVRQKAPATAPHEEAISFHNGAIRLSGTVIRPEGQGPFPGVVFLHGSGSEARWANRFLATELARRGVAALIYDKRGVGASTGDWRQAGLAELVADASAAVEALRAQTGIDPARVGIHGHSQGGTYSPWVANENPHVAFVIGSAASGVSMAETERYSLENAVGISRLSPEERPLAQRFVDTLVATEYGGASYEELNSVWQSVSDRSWAFEPPPASDPFWSFARRIGAYDPLEHWRQVTAPTLLIYGGDDERVPLRKSAARIADAYLSGSGTRLDIRIFPGADHTLRLRAPAAGNFQWPKSAPDYPEALIRWILEVTHPGIQN